MEFPTAEAADHCTRHYMWCKAHEYRDALALADLIGGSGRIFEIVDIADIEKTRARLGEWERKPLDI